MHEELFLAGLCHKIKAGFLSADDFFHAGFTGNIFYLAAAERIFCGKLLCLNLIQKSQLVLPQELFSFHRRILQLDFKKKTSFEGRVKIVYKICCCVFRKIIHSSVSLNLKGTKLYHSQKC